MSRTAAFSIAIVCEGPTDLRVATALADRLLSESVDWIDQDTLEAHRKWRGLEESDEYLPWRRAPELARSRGIEVHGRFGGMPDYRAARSALLLLSERKPDAVILVRDSDGDVNRARSLEQARTEFRHGPEDPFPVILGVAHTKLECWILAGFDPQTQEEEKTLAELRRKLGSDPRHSAETLDAQKPQALRSAKRVLDRLTGRDPDRERICWAEHPLDILKERGRLTGLAAYLDEVRDHLVPLFAPKRHDI